MNLKSIFLLFLFVALAACSPAGSEPAASDTATPLPTKPIQPENIILDEATVNSISISILESFPVQVHVNATGFLGDGCTTLADITTSQEGNTFFITINKQRPVDAICTQQLTTFDENIPLDVNGLPAGTYTVNVNGVTDSFTLDMDNSIDMPGDEGGEGAPGGIELPQEDVAELIRLTLERALVAQEIPDYQLLTAASQTIILSTENIDPTLVPQLAGINLMLLSPEEVQAKANAEGDFLYLRFAEITAVSPTNAFVSLDNTWMPATGSEMGYLSGGGFTIEYEKTANGWQGEITGMWIS